MLKNLVPFIIVALVVIIGGAGVYFLMNQKTSPVDINSTSNNTFATVTPQQAQDSQTQQVKSITAPTAVPTIVSSKTLDDGLKIEDEVVGKGQEVKSGDTISIHYLGTLENGQKFDSSYDRGQPFVTQIGAGQVIKGWDEGVIGMKVGGRRRLTIPPDLGYGNQSAGSIPPNSTLIFDVLLVGIK